MNLDNPLPDPDDEPKRYACTLIDLIPDDRHGGFGIPRGVIVEITGKSRLTAHWNGVSLDVDLWEIDPDCNPLPEDSEASRTSGVRSKPFIDSCPVETL